MSTKEKDFIRLANIDGMTAMRRVKCRGSGMKKLRVSVSVDGVEVESSVVPTGKVQETVIAYMDKYHDACDVYVEE